MPLEVKSHVREQDEASIDSFFLVYFKVQGLPVLKLLLIKKHNVRRGLGGGGASENHQGVLLVKKSFENILFPLIQQV